MSDINALPPLAVSDDAILRALNLRSEGRRLGADAILIPTDVLLPDRSVLVVVVTGGAPGGRLTISDAGAALAVLGNVGLPGGRRVISAATRTARSHGLNFEISEVRSPPLSSESLPSGLKWFADGVRRVSEAAISEARRRQRSLLRERIGAQLRTIFSEAVVREKAVIRGHSSESHKFDFLIAGTSGARMVVDAPVPDSSSVSSVLLRHLDVRAANQEGLIQVVAYDEADGWPAPALDQLRLTRARLVPSDILETLKDERIG